MPPEHKTGYYLQTPASEQQAVREAEILSNFRPNEDFSITMDRLMNGPIEVRMAVLKWRDPYEPPERHEWENPYSRLEELLAEYPQEHTISRSPLDDN